LISFVPLICIFVTGIQGGNLGVKTPPSTENFFNLLEFFENKIPKYPQNFAIHIKKFQNSPLKKFLASSSFEFTLSALDRWEIGLTNLVTTFQLKFRRKVNFHANHFIFTLRTIKFKFFIQLFSAFFHLDTVTVFWMSGRASSF